MATIQDFEERIEKQKAELAKLEAKKKELEKKIRERNRKWRSLVTHSAGESVLSAVGCAWQELNLDALDRFLASHGARLRRYRRTLQGGETDGDNDELRLSRENPERHGR